MTNKKIRKSTADGRVTPLPCGDIKWRDEKKYRAIRCKDKKQAPGAGTAPGLAVGMGNYNIYGIIYCINPLPEGTGISDTSEPGKLKICAVPSG